MWHQQILVTSAVPVYPARGWLPGEDAAAGVQPGHPDLRQRRLQCARQLQQLMEALVRLCRLTLQQQRERNAASNSVVSGTTRSATKVTADVAVGTHDVTERVPPLPDLIQSCSSQYGINHYTATTGTIISAQALPHRETAQVSDSRAGAAVGDSNAAASEKEKFTKIGSDLRQCADNFDKAATARKYRRIPAVAWMRGARGDVSAHLLVATSTMLLLWHWYG